MGATGSPAIAVSAGFTDYGDYLGVALSRPLIAAGAVPVFLPYLEDAEARDGVLDRVDGLLLGFGRHIAPERYGASPHPAMTETSPMRDASELSLAIGALERDMPILGICRGMQILNVARGGTLHQHVPDLVGHEDHRRIPGAFGDHDVRLQDGSLAARAAGSLRVPTKSHHHQAIDELGAGLRITGWSSLDELPEAIELPGARFALGVQWHPEADEASEVIAALVQEARGRALAA